MNGAGTAVKIADQARLLLDSEGADGVTMRRVAQAAGITAMALYRHYPDRAGLLKALADDGFAKLASRLAPMRSAGSVEKRLRSILEVYIDFALERPHLFELMFLTRRAGARRYPADFRAGQSPTANIAAEAVREGMRSGYFRRGDAWEITLEMGALLQGLVMLYQGGRLDMDEKAFRAFCHRSFRRYFRGIRK